MFKSRLYKWVLAIALIHITIVAWFSEGYLGYDEQVQILEAIQARLNGVEVGEVCWDYKERIRSSLQPILGEGIIRFLKFSGITSPHSHAFVLRLLIGVFSVAAVYRFSLSLNDEFAEKHGWVFVILSLFLWVIPFNNVRFASETLSSAFFLLGFSFAYTNKQRLYLAGVLMGFAFLARYHLITCITGFSLWMLWSKKYRFHEVMRLIMGVVSVFALGILLDSWFYQEFTLTLWLYFKVNLIDGIAADFGVLPWYYYLVWSFQQLTIPIGIMVLGAIPIFLFRYHKHAISWIILPFIVMHFVISHKEVRYILPIIYFLPFVLIKFYNIALLQYYNNTIRRVLIYAFTGINILMLLVVSVRPAGDGSVRIDSILHALSEEASVIYLGEASKLKLFPFYQDPKWSYSVSNQLRIESSTDNRDQYWVISDADFTHLNTNASLEKVHEMYPDWLVFLQSFYYVDNRIFNYGVYRLK